MEVPVLAKGLDALFGPVDGLEAVSFRETNVLRRGKSHLQYESIPTTVTEAQRNSSEHTED